MSSPFIGHWNGCSTEGVVDLLIVVFDLVGRVVVGVGNLEEFKLKLKASVYTQQIEASGHSGALGFAGKRVHAVVWSAALKRDHSE